MTLKIGVCGAAGRMGKTILALCAETAGVEATAAIEHGASPAVGRDAGELAGVGSLGVPVSVDIAALARPVDVMIDFSLAAGVAANIQKCAASNINMVIGTTGLSPADHKRLRAAAERIAIVFAPNMSVGVNLCLKLLELTAGAIGADSDIEIIEAHHRHKKDAPSGTALGMGEAVAATLGRDLSECAVYDRRGGGARRPGSIGFQAIRAGDIVGEHTVMFAAEGERIEISHKAFSRKTFANGALRAAKWLAGKDRGLFDMRDVLSLR